MNKESLQAAFDKSCAGVIKQGRRSVSSPSNMNACVYRGEGGVACAVGHLISDEQIAKYGIIESTNPLVFPYLLLEEILPGVPTSDAKNFLFEMRDAHDLIPLSHDFITEFKANANKIAAKWGLKPL